MTWRPTVGDEIVWGDLTSREDLRSGTVTKIMRGLGDTLIFVDHHHKIEDCIYSAYCWPRAARAELLTIIDTRLALKKAYDDSMGLIYELRNKVSRGEIK